MRKLIPSILIVFISILISGCQSGIRRSISTKLLDKVESCAGDPLHSYALYIPEAESKCSSLPLVIILDPQGNGDEAIEHFKEGADKYGCILAASLLVKNNYPDYINAINTLIEDVQNKFPAGNRIYLAGFSGGGRMVLNFAQHFSVSGLLVCGGLAPAEQLNQIASRVVSIAGLADFNFIETAQYVFNVSRSPSNLIIDFTENTHEWADETAIANALGYLIYSSEENENCLGKTAVKHFCLSMQQEIDLLKAEKKNLQAGILARKMAVSQKFNTREEFTSIRNSLEFSAPFMAERELLRESIRFELAVRNEYNAALQQQDIAWWQKEIISLDTKIETDKDMFRKYAYLRIKGFLGILCYSLAGKSLNGDDPEDTERLLSIYSMVEPQNPDMFYFSALLALRQEKLSEAESFLIQALNAGFSDRQEVLNKFPTEIIDAVGLK